MYSTPSRPSELESIFGIYPYLFNKSNEILKKNPLFGTDKLFQNNRVPMVLQEPDFVANSVSWNPWHGCRRVSEGCRNCYMFLGDEKRGVKGSNIVRISKTQFDLPLKKNRNGLYSVRDKIVLSSMTSDFFIEEADEWRSEAWRMIRKRKDLTFILLTKRPERMIECLPPDWGDGYENVRLSVSTENQDAWDLRVPILKEVPARKHDIFMAPMIGPIDVGDDLKDGIINCIYLGGEYCDNARPCRYEWVQSVREKCVESGVTFHWRNTGSVFIKNGKTFIIENIADQGRVALSSSIDHIVDNVIPERKYTQSKLP